MSFLSATETMFESIGHPYNDASAGPDTVHRLAAGSQFVGTLSEGDEDWIEVRLVAGQVYSAFVSDRFDISIVDAKGDDTGRIIDIAEYDFGSSQGREQYFLAETSGAYFIRTVASVQNTPVGLDEAEPYIVQFREQAIETIVETRDVPGSRETDVTPPYSARDELKYVLASIEPGDSDWFTFELEAGVTYGVSAFRPDWQLEGLSVILHDGTGVLAQSTGSLHFTPAVDGTYFFEVLAPDGETETVDYVFEPVVMGPDQELFGPGLDLGGANGDFLVGGLGSDTLHGLGGDDDLTGNRGPDALFGGDGNDSLNGGHGADTMAGDAGTDILRGGVGRDELFGGSGADMLHGGIGGDLIKGGRGEDTLFSGSGWDTLTGGADADRFVIRGAQGENRITDFDVTEDQLDVTFLAIGQDLTARDVLRDLAETQHGDTIFTFENGVLLVLEGVTDLPALEAALFV